MESLLRCSRYAFGPNRLHYCGPNASGEIYAHMEDGVGDLGLRTLLEKFETLYPYLRFIARTNHIADPLDTRVVEAYWLGNHLLEAAPVRQLYAFLVDDLDVRAKLTPHTFDNLKETLQIGGLPFHAFHVFSVWTRTRNRDDPAALTAMDECRISWGTVESVVGPTITVTTEPLVRGADDRLALGALTKRTIARRLDATTDIDEIVPGDSVSVHWGVPCEVISAAQVSALKKYTAIAIRLANATL